jgi:hypothetical protein
MIPNLWFHNLAAHSLQVALVVATAMLLAWLMRLRTPAARLAYFQLVLLLWDSLFFSHGSRPLPHARA